MLLGILLVLQILVSAALTAVILLQRSEGGALGMGGGPSGFMTARGAGDLLTRTTAILATVFFILSLVLTMVSGKLRGDGSVVDRVNIEALSPEALRQPPANQTAPAPGGGLGAPVPQVQTLPAPAPSTAPADVGTNSPASQVLGVQTAPQAPQPAPAAPQPAAPAQ